VNAYLQAGLDALNDGTRMAIFQKLANGPMAVNEIAATLPVSRPAVSQHLRVLQHAGLITGSKTGTRRHYQLDPEGIARLRAHFDQVWDKALISFQASVASPKASVRTEKKNNKKGGKKNAKDPRSRRP
jgi:DNA-binding transcriptional ArsR family regulator